MLLNEKMSDIIKQKKKLEENTKILDKYCIDILERRREILDTIDRMNEEHIKPLKDEISQIDADIERIMTETGQEKITSDNYGAYIKNEISIKVTDISKAFKWAMKNPKVLKKDILKLSKVNELIKEGEVPDPETDGVDCNDSYQKISFRRK